MKTIGVDVGGTFTDLVYVDSESGRLIVHKVPTTPDQPANGVMAGIEALCADHAITPGSIDHVFHGTTIATNAMLEHKGAKTGMITNDGFRDIIHIGRHQRVEHYSIMQTLPWQQRPLVKRRHRKTVPGRLTPPHGNEVTPLDEDAVRRAAEELRDEGVEAVVIAFLFAYLNPDHERRAQAIVEAVMPDAFVTTSSFIAPQFREFERFTTASMAAFIGPKVGRYIRDLDGSLKAAGIAGDLRIMASHGGVATPKMTSEKPTLTLLSGLVAGVLGGAWIGGLAGRKRLISFDIGGTSADIGITVDGVFAETDARSASIAGFPLLMPMLDIHTIGAGGGSIAYRDHGGAFRVGPRSAGADPGPAAYGRGGAEPTVTDAHVVLGRLDPGDGLAGNMCLDADAARAAIQRLADQLGLSLHETAAGVLTIINANMANAIRSRTVQKGIDPRGFALVAFGGAGPLHGAEVAALLDIPEVIVPPFPGITSAMGLLTTDLKYDAIRTQFQTSATIDLEGLKGALQAMEAEIKEQFAADGIAPLSITLQRFAELRYVGQGYELKVPIASDVVTEASLAELWRDFHAAHMAEYSHAFDANPIEIVNLRVSGIGEIQKLKPVQASEGGSLDQALIRVRPAIFRVGGDLTSLETRFFSREDLPVGQAVEGPAILLQADSTTVVPPGCSFAVDPSGSVVIRTGSVR
ncbi:MAG: hydantoinase/oxoprolinase family protein [Alphaproteobacteria bacterium]